MNIFKYRFSKFIDKKQYVTTDTTRAYSINVVETSSNV